MIGHSQTRKQKAGTRIIGKGRFGTTYFPPLQCLHPDEQPKGNVVSKSVTRKVARQEYMLTRPLRLKNYDFTCHPIETCQGVGSLKVNGKKEERWLLFSKYGGKPITQHIRYFEDEMMKFGTMIKAMKDLRTKIMSMNENDKIFHNDVSLENMTYDEHDNKAYLIDFGDMSKNEREGSDILLFDQALVTVYHRVFSALKEAGISEEDWTMLQNFYNPPNSN